MRVLLFFKRIVVQIDNLAVEISIYGKRDVSNLCAGKRQTLTLSGYELRTLPLTRPLDCYVDD